MDLFASQLRECPKRRANVIRSGNRTVRPYMAGQGSPENDTGDIFASYAREDRAAAGRVRRGS